MRPAKYTAYVLHFYDIQGCTCFKYMAYGWGTIHCRSVHVALLWCFILMCNLPTAYILAHLSQRLIVELIYYSKFDKGQNFNFVCRRLCVSDTKNFMIDM